MRLVGHQVPLHPIGIELLVRDGMNGREQRQGGGVAIVSGGIQGDLLVRAQLAAGKHHSCFGLKGPNQGAVLENANLGGFEKLSLYIEDGVPSGHRDVGGGKVEVGIAIVHIKGLNPCASLMQGNLDDPLARIGGADTQPADQ